MRENNFIFSIIRFLATKISKKGYDNTGKILEKYYWLNNILYYVFLYFNENIQNIFTVLQLFFPDTVSHSQLLQFFQLFSDPITEREPSYVSEKKRNKISKPNFEIKTENFRFAKRVKTKVVHRDL